LTEGFDAGPYLREVALLRDGVPSFDEYPFSLAAVRVLDRLALHPAVTFIVGENGTGKSTLLEAIAVAWGFNPEGGTRNFNFASRESHADLYKWIRQFVIATHSLIIMAYPDALIYEFSRDGLRTVEYHDTEHYRVTRAFLNRPEQMLRHLFEEDDEGPGGGSALEPT
jgi:predicted ATPase